MTVSRPRRPVFAPDPHAWVKAEPFRAHARLLLAGADLPWPGLAVATGLSLACLDHLLHGRFGRPVRRVSPYVAARLLRWHPDDLVAAARAWVPVRDAPHRLGALLAAGASPDSVAAYCGLSTDDLAALVDLRTPGFPQSVAWLTEAAERHWSAQGLVPVAA
ncbi:MAG: hypothetical protein HZY73_14130 [Micropruina sp.]|nr:MAG: hypothetical protein HZY73_14130 [Micropruina sp.]